MENTCLQSSISCMQKLSQIELFQLCAVIANVCQVSQWNLVTRSVLRACRAVVDFQEVVFSFCRVRNMMGGEQTCGAAASSSSLCWWYVLFVTVPRDLHCGANKRTVSLSGLFDHVCFSSSSSVSPAGRPPL